jgi:hypothetical protein
MPEIKEINDRRSQMLPDIEELRESQKEGGEGKGPKQEPEMAKESFFGPLNSCQGHEVEIKD